MRNALSKKIIDIQPSGIRKFFDVVNEIPDAISLGVGEPDFDTPWNVREEGIYALEKGRTFYTSNAGLKELREEICNYVARKYNVVYNPLKETLVTVGPCTRARAAFGSSLRIRPCIGASGSPCARGPAAR